MEYTAYSRIRLIKSAQTWDVPLDFFDPLRMWLLHGLYPGSFWTAVLANNWADAITRSHHANTIDGLKNTTKWIVNTWPRESHGSAKKRLAWSKMTDEERRPYIEQAGLVYTEQEEVMMSLRGEQVEDEEWVRKVWF